MWKCKACGEEVEDQFDQCWHCSAVREGAPRIDANEVEAEADESKPYLGSCLKCGTAVAINHPYAWCSECGEPLPAEMRSQLSNAYVREDAPDQPSARAPASAPSTAVLVCAIGLIAAFFMPWVEAFGAGVSGYSLGRTGSYGNYAWIIPALACVTVLVSLTGGSNRAIGALSGIVPLVALLYGLMRLAGEAPSAVTNEVLDIAGRSLAIGGWLTIGFSIAIIVAALSPSPAPDFRQSVQEQPAPSATVPPAVTGQPAVDPAKNQMSDELGRLADLHAKGVLTAEEFTLAKAKLLG